MSGMSNFVLTVPIAKGHWVTLVSNRQMEPGHFALLDRYLALQKEIADVAITAPEDRDGLPS